MTEISFETSDPRYPLCGATAGSSVYAVVRVHDTGSLSGRTLATIAFVGPRTMAEALVSDLRARPGHEVEVLTQAEQATWLRLEGPVDAPGPCLAGLPQALGALGWAAIVEPIVVSEGRVRGRIVVPAEVDPAEALRAVPTLQRALGFAQFRVVRVGEVAPGMYTTLARRILAPEQDDLLALANSMGYYATPKSVTLGQIAQVVGLSVSPVHKRLKAAEEKLVQLQVDDSPAARPRRLRREIARAAPGAPWEAGLRVRSAALGPASILVNHPETRALIVPQGEDRARGTCGLLMLLTGPAEVQARVRAQLAQRPEVSQVQTVAQDRDSVAYRFLVEGHQGYGLRAWCDALGTDAPIRSIVIEGDEATVRFMVLRPSTLEDLDGRLAEVAKAAGWQEHELVWLHPVRDRGAPASTPEPLTARQREVLRVATALGYYKTPRGCTLEGVATTLGVSANAIHKNLVLAESKLIASYLASSL